MIIGFLPPTSALSQQILDFHLPIITRCEEDVGSDSPTNTGYKGAVDFDSPFTARREVTLDFNSALTMWYPTDVQTTK